MAHAAHPAAMPQRSACASEVAQSRMAAAYSNKKPGLRPGLRRSSSSVGGFLFGRSPETTTIRAVAAAIALSLLTVAMVSASPQVEAALKAFQTIGADTSRLRAFCELMQVEEENAETTSGKAKINRLLDELGPDFKSAWKTAEDIDPASDDGKVLFAALDRLFDKCSE